jgi:hypothetical protein
MPALTLSSKARTDSCRRRINTAILKITDTVGSGKTTTPKGMWTMIPGD